MCLSIPPKYGVAGTIGFLRGKPAIRVHRQFVGRKPNPKGLDLLAKGYCASTAGLDEQTIVRSLGLVADVLQNIEPPEQDKEDSQRGEVAHQP